MTDLVGVSGKGVLLGGVGMCSKSNITVGSCCMLHVDGV